MFIGWEASEPVAAAGLRPLGLGGDRDPDGVEGALKHSSGVGVNILHLHKL